MSWWQRHFGKLFSSSIISRIGNLLRGKPSIDKDLIESLKKLMVEADMGGIADKAITHIQSSKEEPLIALEQFLISIFPEQKIVLDQPLNIILVVGVNGVGKTTSIAKLLHHFNKTHRVMVASGDTYRAAAEDQLGHWASKVGVDMVESGNTKDPAAVMYDAIKQAKAKDKNLLIVDTAGRMHGNQNLMDQLEKIKRVCAKLDGQLKPKVWLVLDGSLGQSNVAQAEVFYDKMGAEGIILTKLDGSSKGGSIFSVVERYQLPVYFLGVGESIDDLVPFDRNVFVKKVLQ